MRGHNGSLVIYTSSNIHALDHVFHVAGIILSLALSPHIPKEACDSFFSVSVFITLKDKVLQPSIALCHSTELCSIIKSNFISSTLPMVVVTSDGEPLSQLHEANEAINKSPSLEVAFRDSTSPLMACIASRFCYNYEIERTTYNLFLWCNW